MVEIEIALLGPPLFRRDGHPVTTFRSRKGPALLAYLVLEKEPATREQLAAFFWPEMADGDARGELRRILHDLNRQLPGLLEADRLTICYRPVVPVHLDVELLAAAPAVQVDGMEAAAGLYRGELLKGVVLADCPGFESWLHGQRERWRQEATALFDRLIALYETQADYDAALSAARRLLALEPWREEVHRRVMILLARSGRRGAALAQYEACRRALAEELSVAPSHRTSALYQRIRATAFPGRHNLPAQATPFLGREEELARLRRLLVLSGRRLVTITGPGGSGKTRLAIEAATAAAPHFLDGVLFLSLASIRPGQLAAALVDALAENGLIAGDAGDRPAGQALKRHLAERELLLVLDNAEAALAEHPLLLSLVGTAPGLRLLVTSRERLNVAWEEVLPLDGLAYPAEASAPAWEAHSAVRLFLDAAQRALPGFQPGPEERAAITRICGLVQGLPLALELAATWLRVASCATIAAELEADALALGAAGPDRPPRQTTLRATFDYSWRTLSPAEREAFARLSTFPGSFSAAAATAVSGAGRHLLAALLDKSLLQATATGPERHYRLHPLLRQYGAGRLAERGETLAVQARHARYYCQFVAAQTAALRGGDQLAALRRLERESANLPSAWEWAVSDRQWADVAGALEGLYLFFLMRNLLVTGVPLFDAAARAVPAEEQPALRSRLLSSVAIFKMRGGQDQEATDYAAQALSLALAAADPRAEALSRYTLGRVAYKQGRYPEGVRQGEAALAIFAKLADERWQALCFSLLGLTAAVRAKYRKAGAESGRPPEIRIAYLEDAQRYLQQALDHARALGDAFHEANILHNMGYIQYVFGEESGALPHFEAARRHFEDAIALDRTLETVRPQRLNWLACSLCMLGETEAAGPLFFEGLAEALRRQLLTEAADLLANLTHFLLADQPALAAELFAVVHHHPATDARIRQWAGEELGRLAGLLDPAEFHAAQSRAVTLSLGDATDRARNAL